MVEEYVSGNEEDGENDDASLLFVDVVVTEVVARSSVASGVVDCVEEVVEGIVWMADVEEVVSEEVEVAPDVVGSELPSVEPTASERVEIE